MSDQERDPSCSDDRRNEPEAEERLEAAKTPNSGRGADIPDQHSGPRDEPSKGDHEEPREIVGEPVGKGSSKKKRRRRRAAPPVKPAPGDEEDLGDDSAEVPEGCEAARVESEPVDEGSSGDAMDPDEAVDLDEPDEDSPLLRRDDYIDPEERARLEAASEELEREEMEAERAETELLDIPSGRLDTDAVKVVSRLRRFEHEAYLVGGCVRDLLLGLSPKDFDLATSARPEEIKRAFTNCRLIGRRFRLAHVYFRGGKVIETATFRRNPRQEDDAETEDEDLYLAADNVYGTAEEDARRRDFTINALFYDPRAGRVIDFVGGKDDLERGLIRTVGDPAVRMPEDPVRILRAVRFAAKLGFEIEEGTWQAMKEHAFEIPRCPAPRVTEEILRLLRSGASRGAVCLLQEIRALEVLLPPIHEHLETTDAEGVARFYALLDSVDEWTHEQGKPPDDSVLLAALLFTLFGEDGMPTARSEALDELLSTLVRDARLPRRIAERVRLVLGAQRVFAGHKKRRFSPKRFLRQSYIPHAMALFDMRVRAFGDDVEQYKRWCERLPQLGDDSGSSRDSAGGNETGSTRRRRRRRRGGRRSR